MVCYRGYVATTRSDLVLAIDDALVLLLSGCSLKDPRILLEARKRHHAGERSMQMALQNQMHETL